MYKVKDIHLPKMIKDISEKLGISKEEVHFVFHSFVAKNQKRDLKIGVRYFQDRLEEIIIDSINCTERYYKIYYDYGGFKNDS